MDSFGAAFRRVPKGLMTSSITSLPASAGTGGSAVAGGATATAATGGVPAPLQYMFDIALEIKEEDNKVKH